MKASTWLVLSCTMISMISLGCESKYQAAKFLINEQNKLVEPPPIVSKEMEERHQDLEFIADMHADTGNWSTFFEEKNEQLLGKCEDAACSSRRANSKGHVDAVRLVKGNVALQVFALINGGSADQYGDSRTFQADIYNDATGREEPKTLLLRNYQRNPASGYFRGHSKEGSEAYEKQYWMTPRPPIQYVLNFMGYPCEYWYHDHPDPDRWFRKWPFYAWGRLTNQTCPEADADPFHDIQLNWSKKFSENLHSAAKDSLDEEIQFSIIKSRENLVELIQKRKISKNSVGAMLSTEGLYMEGYLTDENTDRKVEQLFYQLYNDGYRMLALTHFVDSEFGGSSTGAGDLNWNTPYGPYDPDSPPWDKKSRGLKIGLSSAGRTLVKLMLKHGVIIDVAHASPNLVSALVDQAVKARRPLVCSHTGLKLFTGQDPRNLSKNEVIEIAATNGIIGIGYWDKFVGGSRPIDFARAVRFLVDLIDSARIHQFNDPSAPLVRGIDVAALGSDFDGGIKAMMDTAQLGAITQALTCTYDPVFNPDCLEDNFNLKELKQIMGENTKRVMMALLPEKTRKLP